MPVNNLKTYFGNTDELIDEIAPAFIEASCLIAINGYNNLITNEKIDNWGEVKITAHLIKYMRIAKKNLSLPINIEPEYHDYGSENLSYFDEPEKSPRIDIHVQQWRMPEDVFFTFECKKLKNSDSKSITAYVTEGMVRYISGKYAPYFQQGGMIGYIFYKNITELKKIVLKINKKIPNQQLLSKKDILKKCSRYGHSDEYVSQHNRKKGISPFEIIHLFFGYDT